jgi:hypothetical protein
MPRNIFLVLLLVLVAAAGWLGCGGASSNSKTASADDEASPADDDDDDNDDQSPSDDDASPADDDDDASPTRHLLPGPDEPGYDAALEAKATRYDRGFQNFNAYGLLINADVVVPLDAPANRRLVQDFLQTTDSWDFQAWSGKDPEEIISDNQATAGLYAGSGIAADAFRYGVMRDQGYPQEDVDRARQFVLRGMEGLRIAVEITGVKGVIARGYLRKDIPGAGATTPVTPLFDDQDNPLPPVKTNGTWRADNSPDHKYPNYIWTDGCSRDMLLGWAAAFGGVWEAIKDDPTFDPELKALHQQYASDVAHNLMTVKPDGYDLEIGDADGRTTINGLLNENAWDTIYLPWLGIKDGGYTLMSLGIISALAYASEDPEVVDYLYQTLLGPRRFQDITYHNIIGINLWWETNYGDINMAFQGMLLAQRYIDDEETIAKLRHTLAYKLYDYPPDATRMPKQFSYSLFDFAYAAGVADMSAYHPAKHAPDEDAMQRGVETLKEFPDAPYWEVPVTNCSPQAIQNKACELMDGTWVTVLGYVGRDNELITLQPFPQRDRPPSNYHWRTNPFDPNGGGDGSRLLPAVDWRWAYWYARWAK